MRLVKLILLMAVLLSSAQAASRITLTITVTNAPADADTLVVNGGTRTWKTSVATPSTEITVGADAGASATNLWNQIVANPYAGPLNPSFSSSNVITLRGQTGNALTASLSGTWATLSLSTQPVATASIVRVPVSSEPVQSAGTNIISQLANDLVTYSSNSFGVGNTLLANYADLTTSQTLSNKHIFGGTSTNSQFGILNAWITNAYMYGAFNLTNDSPEIYIYDTDGAADSKATLITAYSGNLTIKTLSDDGMSTENILSVSRTGEAVDNVYIGDANTTTVFSGDITLSGTMNSGNFDGPTITGGLLTTSTYSGDIGSLTNGTIKGSTITGATYSGTIGTLSSGVITGAGITNATSTNIVLKGLSQLSGATAFNRANHTSMANGANAAVDFGSATFIKIKAGPTGAFSIAGIANGADGDFYILYNATGQNMTISNDSGTDPTPANRIYTGTGSDIATTANGAVTVVYDSEDSRWVVTAVRD